VRYCSDREVRCSALAPVKGHVGCRYFRLTPLTRRRDLLAATLDFQLITFSPPLMIFAAIIIDGFDFDADRLIRRHDTRFSFAADAIFAAIFISLDYFDATPIFHFAARLPLMFRFSH
jgi:hypothetical protein